MSRKISHYEWLPDLPDHRDYLYAAPIAIAAVLPCAYLTAANLASDFWTIRLVH